MSLYKTIFDDRKYKINGNMLTDLLNIRELVEEHQKIHCNGDTHTDFQVDLSDKLYYRLGRFFATLEFEMDKEEFWEESEKNAR